MAWEYGTRPRGSTPPDYTLAHYTRTSSFASPAYVPVQDPFDYTLFRRTFSSSSSDPSFRRVFTNSAYYSEANDAPWDRGNSDSQTWTCARESMQQQTGMLAFSTPGSFLRHSHDHEWFRHPPTSERTTTTWIGRSEMTSENARSIYTANDPNQFDVVHHDPTRNLRKRVRFGSSTYYDAAPPPRPRRGRIES